MYYLIGEQSFVKKSEDRDELLQFAQNLEIKDRDCNCVMDYKIVMREDVEEELMNTHNISLSDGLYLGERNDLQNFFRALENFDIK